MHEAVLVSKEHAACAASLACVFDGIASVIDAHLLQLIDGRRSLSTQAGETMAVPYTEWRT